MLRRFQKPFASIVRSTPDGSAPQISFMSSAVLPSSLGTTGVSAFPSKTLSLIHTAETHARTCNELKIIVPKSGHRRSPAPFFRCGRWLGCIWHEFRATSLKGSTAVLNYLSIATHIALSEVTRLRGLEGMAASSRMFWKCEFHS